MPFYQPRTLFHDLRTRGSLPFEECARVGLALTSALAHLHRHGLVHRDVKPSNIIFVDGVPKLADVGLVAATNESRSFVGTPGYIAPEGPGTPAADLYSLGKVSELLQVSVMQVHLAKHRIGRRLRTEIRRRERELREPRVTPSRAPG